MIKSQYTGNLEVIYGNVIYNIKFCNTKEKVILDITVQINLRVDDEIKKIAKNIKE